MKKLKKGIWILPILMLCTNGIFAQIGNLGFNFQALIRDSKGAPVIKKSITLKFTLYPGSSPSIDYEETDPATTDSFGVCTAIIGNGQSTSSSRLNNFGSIDFTSAVYQYQVSFSSSGTSGPYTAIGNRQSFYSVPYARAAGNVTSVPMGAVMAFAGDSSNVPTGWLLCDGRQLSVSGKYQNLYNAIHFYWGGSGATFYLPDLRGQFLRGVDYGKGNDPDTSLRTALNGGNIGDRVGSYQADDFKSHNHSAPNSGTFVTYSGYGCTSTAPAGGNVNAANSGAATTSTGGNETRPKNAYVNFIIKY